MTPRLSYTLWFSQRNGSSLLCEGLKSTKIAGIPEEHFHKPREQSLLDKFQVKSYEVLQQKIWKEGTSPNGIFGIKVNAPQKENDPIIEELKNFPAVQSNSISAFEIWESIFPNGKHIFLTRRNKIRQAVSWWKAIVSEEWHRVAGKTQSYNSNEIIDRYDFDAIKHLLIEITLRESKIQAFLEQGKATALTVVYEDFIQGYENTIRKIIDFLGIKEKNFSIDEPHYEKLADEVSDIWTERFRKEIQKDWDHIIW